MRAFPTRLLVAYPLQWLTVYTQPGNHRCVSRGVGCTPSPCPYLGPYLGPYLAPYLIDLDALKVHTIAAIARHDVDAHGHEGYDWRDFMTWAQGAVASLCRERVVLSRSTSSYNVVAKKRREVKMKQLGDLSKKLINIVRLVLDDNAKSLGLALPWEIDRARGGAAGMNTSTDEGENAGTVVPYTAHNHQ